MANLDPLPDLDPLEPLEDLEPLESMENEISPQPIIKPVIKCDVEEPLATSDSTSNVPVTQDDAPVVYAHETQFTQANPYSSAGVVIIKRPTPAVVAAPEPAKAKLLDRFKVKSPTKEKGTSATIESKAESKQGTSVMPPHEMGDPTDYFRIENWYDDLKEHTFRTIFCDLTLEEARAITHYRESHKMFMQMMAWQIKEGKVAAPTSEAAYREMVDKELTLKMKPEDTATIAGVVGKLQGAIELLGCKHGAFVRLSTRSPKDSALSSERMKQLIKTAIQQSSVTDPQEAMNEDLNIFVTACSESLRVETGQQAANLLLHSNRVMEDLMRCELVLKGTWSMQLIVREWWQGLYPPFEFRCFVYNQQMTAITQYYSLCYLREMVDNKRQIQAAILAKWEQLKHVIKVESYTIDFALSRDLSEVWVVELNHLPPTAGTALFDYSGNAVDRAQIETGLAPGATEPALEFRIRTGICPNIAANDELGLAAIHAPLRVVIDEARGRPPEPVIYKAQLPAVSNPKSRRSCVVS